MDGESPNCQGQPWIMTLLSAVLIFGLVVSPLIVVCIPEQGEVLIELLGQDPCHHSGNNVVRANPPSPASIADSDPCDPCQDLVLDNLGLSQDCIDAHVTLQSGILEFCATALTAEGSQPLLGPVIFFKLAREPILSALPGTSSFSSLRI